jgi:hypothetical protein
MEKVAKCTFFCSDSRHRATPSICCLGIACDALREEPEGGNVSVPRIALHGRPAE